MSRMHATLVHHAVNTLLTNYCVLCGDSVRAALPLCGGCQQQLPWQDACCPRCALPLAQAAAACGHCLKQAPSFDRCITAFRYEEPVDRLIGRFKNQRSLLHGNLLSRLLADHIAAHVDAADRPDFITFVPLHWWRQLRRGFNQSAYIALTVSRALDIPLRANSRRLKATPKQQRLTRKQRLGNLADAFHVQDDALADRHVAIIDDVVTTQATAEALSKSYRRAGARRVDVWALARTPPPRHG